MEALSGHHIIVGTYEEFVLGFSVTGKSGQITPAFSDHSHAGGAVRTVAAAGKFAASGAADENVRLLNLRRCTHHGDLRNLHQDTVTQLVFYDRAHLVTAADDGSICILRTKDFQVEKTLKKHTGGVTSLSIHPSGKILLSTAKDGKLITWNLIKGRSAYVTNLHATADLVRWSPDGARYLVGLRGRVDVYRTATAKVECSIPMGEGGHGRANEIAFLDEDTAVIAGDVPEIEIHCLKEMRLLHKVKVHERRVRCLHVEKGSVEGEFSLVTASNDGLIKIWRLRRIGREAFECECVATKDCGCRITCMAVHRVPEVPATASASASSTSTAKKARKKRKQGSEEQKEEVEVESEEEEEEEAEKAEPEVVAKKSKSKKARKRKAK